mmetsp:Transcript_4321/g.7579  ORF Transcript_4321/g.7579 Transcript_4321/m.7579 type:complete len:200 (-) Transcript_4321:934-1533(-)
MLCESPRIAANRAGGKASRMAWGNVPRATFFIVSFVRLGRTLPRHTRVFVRIAGSGSLIKVTKLRSSTSFRFFESSFGDKMTMLFTVSSRRKGVESLNPVQTAGNTLAFTIFSSTNSKKLLRFSRSTTRTARSLHSNRLITVGISMRWISSSSVNWLPILMIGTNSTLAIGLVLVGPDLAPGGPGGDTVIPSLRAGNTL